MAIDCEAKQKLLDVTEMYENRPFSTKPDNSELSDTRFCLVISTLLISRRKSKYFE